MSQVVHLAEGFISDSGMLEALQACRQAAKVGELLQALRRLTFKLNSGDPLTDAWAPQEYLSQNSSLFHGLISAASYNRLLVSCRKHDGLLLCLQALLR